MGNCVTYKNSHFIALACDTVSTSIKFLQHTPWQSINAAFKFHTMAFKYHTIANNLIASPKIISRESIP